MLSNLNLIITKKVSVIYSSYLVNSYKPEMEKHYPSESQSQSVQYTHVSIPSPPEGVSELGQK